LLFELCPHCDHNAAMDVGEGDGCELAPEFDREEVGFAASTGDCKPEGCVLGSSGGLSLLRIGRRAADEEVGDIEP
jgi:hypothetical protein